MPLPAKYFSYIFYHKDNAHSFDVYYPQVLGTGEQMYHCGFNPLGKVQIKAILRYCFTFTKKARIKKTDSNKS